MMKFANSRDRIKESSQVHTADELAFMDWEREALGSESILVPINSTIVEVGKSSKPSSAFPRKTKSDTLQISKPEKRRLGENSRQGLADYTKSRAKIAGDCKLVASRESNLETPDRSTTSLILKTCKKAARLPCPLTEEDDIDIEFTWIKRARTSTRVNESYETELEQLDDDWDLKSCHQAGQFRGDLNIEPEEDDLSELSLSLHDLELEDDLFEDMEQVIPSQKSNLNKSGSGDNPVRWRNGFIARQGSSRNLFKNSQSTRDFNASKQSISYAVGGDGGRVEPKSLWESTRDLMQKSRNKSSHSRESQETLIRKMFSDLKSQSVMTFDTDSVTSSQTFGDTTFNEDDASNTEKGSHCRPALRRLLTDLQTGKSSRNLFG